MKHKSKVAEKTIEEKRIFNTQVFTNSIASAAITIDKLHGQTLDCPTLVDELKKSSKQINDGDTSEIEQMLMTQAKTLEYLFYDGLSKLVDLNMINHIELFTNIAFRAQAQCRKTLLTLADLKHPRRAIFIKQQNNAVTQQVNNDLKSNLEKNKKVANELLNEAEHAPLDFRRTSKAVRIDSAMEPME